MQSRSPPHEGAAERALRVDPASQGRMLEEETRLLWALGSPARPGRQATGPLPHRENGEREGGRLKSPPSLIIAPVVGARVPLRVGKVQH